MITASRWVMMRDALAFGETETAAWIEKASDDELLRALDAADFLIYCGPTSPSGSSMIYAKATAIGAVYAHEGRPRALKRGRRTMSFAEPERTKHNDRYFGIDQLIDRADWQRVDDDFIDFWAADPASAREQRRSRLEAHERRKRESAARDPR